jgi:hypothetical protein
MDPNEQLNRIRELCEILSDEERGGTDFRNLAIELSDIVHGLDVHLSNNGSFPEEWENGHGGIGRWTPMGFPAVEKSILDSNGKNITDPNAYPEYTKIRPLLEGFEVELEISGCEGHESLKGEDMGITTYCDGSCRKYGGHKMLAVRDKIEEDAAEISKNLEISDRFYPQDTLEDYS